MTRKQKKQLARIIIAAVLYFVLYAVPAEGWLQLVLYLIPYLVVGWPVLWKAARNIKNGQVFDEHFLMSLATIGAFACREYPEAVAVMLFFQIGELFEQIAVGRSRRSIAALMDIRPDTAEVERGGEVLTVSPDEVALGETIVIKPGERVPLDGVVLEGESMLNTAALTGESVPRRAVPGERILSGCINETGVLRVQVDTCFAESTVSRILDLVENSAEKKARVEHFITRFARWYTPAVVLCAVLLAFLPPLFVGNLWGWVHRALIFLVVSCPCALVISVPLSFFGGIGGASKQGILVKGGNYLEALAHAGIVVFDKTGTLTRGTFAVQELCPASGQTRESLLELAAYAEHYSDHPIARSIEEAYGKPIDQSRIQNAADESGRGLSVMVDGEPVLAGNLRLMEEAKIAVIPQKQPGTVVYLAKNGVFAGSLRIADELKPEAKDAVMALKSLGVRQTVMLTGDNPAIGEAVGQAAGIDDVHAGLLPADKVSWVETLLQQKKKGERLVFVGDGINDAPVLTRADIGIAMGGLGSDAAVEAADIVLIDDNLQKLAAAIRTARRTMRIVYQNIIFALGVKGIVLILGALGLANMWAAVFADVGVSVIAILNAMRMLRFSSK